MGFSLLVSLCVRRSDVFSFTLRQKKVRWKERKKEQTANGFFWSGISNSLDLKSYLSCRTALYSAPLTFILLQLAPFSAQRASHHIHILSLFFLVWVKFVPVLALNFKTACPALYFGVS